MLIARSLSLADTGHFKSVVAKPQNVNVLRDIACASYVAGGNCKWFAQVGSTFTAENVQKTMMDRLSMSDDVGGHYASMLAFPMTEAQYQGGDMDTVMSVTERLLPWEVQSYSNNSHNSFPGGEDAFLTYKKSLNLRSIHFGEDMKAAENQEVRPNLPTLRSLPVAHTRLLP